MDKTALMELIEVRDPDGRSIERIVADAYNETGSPQLAAKRVGVSVATLYQWMREMGIERERRATFRPAGRETAEVTA